MATLSDLIAMTPSSAFGTSTTIPLGTAATINGVTYLSFAGSGVPGATKVSYSILDTGNSETGTAIYTSSNTTLTNRTPTKSTNGNAVITGSSAAIILCSARAEDIIGFVTKQIFVASGTYTPTTGMINCIVECAAGGAGGGGAVVAANNAGQYGGGGGGGGGYSRSYFVSSAVGTSQTVTIGAGGAGGTSTQATGSSGQATSFGSLVIALGGSGGFLGSIASFGTGGSGGVAGTGNLAITGGSGGTGPYSIVSPNATMFLAAGFGGPSMFGSGGIPVQQGSGGGGATTGSAATGFGAGGSGGIVQSQSTSNTAFIATGGAGAPGLVLVTEFCNPQ